METTNPHHLVQCYLISREKNRESLEVDFECHILLMVDEGGGSGFFSNLYFAFYSQREREERECVCVCVCVEKERRLIAGQ